MRERVSFLRQCARSAMAAVLPRSLFMTRGPSNRQAIYLTFDDGPHPEHTPRLLDLMAERSIKGTFFVVGQQVERFPKIIQRMATEGHAIGNHTWSHSDPKAISAKTLVDEITRTNELIAEATGVAPTLFRPPHGKLTATKLWAIWKAKYTVALWNIDPKDYSCHSAVEVTSRLSKWQANSGDIVLLHDVREPIGATVSLIADQIGRMQPTFSFYPLSDL